MLESVTIATIYLGGDCIDGKVGHYRDCLSLRRPSLG